MLEIFCLNQGGAGIKYTLFEAVQDIFVQGNVEKYTKTALHGTGADMGILEQSMC